MINDIKKKARKSTMNALAGPYDVKRNGTSFKKIFAIDVTKTSNYKGLRENSKKTLVVLGERIEPAEISGTTIDGYFVVDVSHPVTDKTVITLSDKPVKNSGGKWI